MRSMLINPRLSSMVRTLRDPFSGWDETIRESMIPEDGAIITRTETVTKQYKCIHEESDAGTIVVKFVPVEVHETDE